MAEVLDTAIISITIFYLVMSFVLTSVQSNSYTAYTDFNYVNSAEILNVDSSGELPNNLWENIQFFASWVSFFFVNAFVFFNIQDAPLILNVFLNIPRIWVFMWLVRYARGG